MKPTTPTRLPETPMPALAIVAIALSSAASMHHHVSALGGAVAAARWPEIVGWGAISALAFSSIFAGIPLWDALRPLVGTERPRHAWVAFFATFFAIGLGGGLARTFLAVGLLPHLHVAGKAVVFVLNAGITVAVCAWFCEIPAALGRRHREAVAERLALVAQLADARARLVSTDDAMRRELAEIMHGRLQSYVVAAMARIAQAQVAPGPLEAARLLDEAAGWVGDVRREGLRRARELTVGEARGLAAAVDALAARFASHLPLRCEWGPGTRSVVLAPRAVEAACRLIEEALLNAYRHADAAGVALAIDRAPDGGLVATVADDGRGFDPAAVVPGLGLAGLDAGLARLGGSREIEARPGHGTTVRIRLPAGAWAQGTNQAGAQGADQAATEAGR